jgi:hypothetical protein
MSIEGHEYLSHLSLLVRHGPQLIVFLARLAGTLTRSVLEKASRDAGDRGRVPVESVSEGDCPSEVSLGERSDRLEDDGGISGVARGGVARVGRGVKGQSICRGEWKTHLVPRANGLGSDRLTGRLTMVSWIVSIIFTRSFSALSAPGVSLGSRSNLQLLFNYHRISQLGLARSTYTNNCGYKCNTGVRTTQSSVLDASLPRVKPYLMCGLV